MVSESALSQHGVVRLVADAMGDLTTAVTAMVDEISAASSPVTLIDLRDLTIDPWPGRVDIRAVTRWERTVRNLEHIDSVTVAYLAGPVSPPALELSLACDIRVAAADTTVDFADPGIRGWPSMALLRLVQQCGLHRVRRLLWLDTALDSDSAVTVGLVDVVTDDLESTLARVSTLAGQAQLRTTRQLLHEATTTAFDEALGAHLAACDRRLRTTPDLEERP